MIFLPYNNPLTGLQTSLSAGTANLQMESPMMPHHPINCQHDPLRLEPDGTFTCPHASVPPDDVRTQGAVNQSIAYLLFELLLARHSS